MSQVFVTSVSVLVPGVDAPMTLPDVLEAAETVAPYRSLRLGALDCHFTRPELPEDDPYMPRGKDTKIMRRDVVLGIVGVGRLLEDLRLGSQACRDAGLFLANGLCQDGAMEQQIEEMCDAYLAEHETAEERMRNQAFYRMLPPLIAVVGLPNAGACFIAREHGLRGPNAVFGVTSHSGHTALREGCSAVRLGRAELAVVGGANSVGMLSALALSPLRSTSGILCEAEAAAFVTIESAEGLERHGREPLCRITSVDSFDMEDLDGLTWFTDLDSPPDMALTGGTVFQDQEEEVSDAARARGLTTRSWFGTIGSCGAASVALDLGTAAVMIGRGDASTVVGVNRDVYGRLSRFVAEVA